MAEHIRVTIDGQTIEVEEGMTILEVARRVGIYIPTLCYVPRLEPYGGCRLCLVEVEGHRRLETSCTTPVVDGMVIKTNTPQVQETRREVLELIISDHPYECLICPKAAEGNRCPPFSVCLKDTAVTDRCLICPKNTRCELQQVVDYIGVRRERFVGELRPIKLERSNPFFEYEPSRCVLCTRCVRICEEVRGVGALDVAYRGFQRAIVTAYEVTMPDSNCEFCGQCVLICPTAALTKRSYKLLGWPDHSVRTVCPYCGCGCEIELELKGDRIVGVTPVEQSPVNEGCLCVKGHFGYDFIQSPERLTQPLLRRPTGSMGPIEWDQALDTVVENLERVVAEHGPDAVAVISSAKITNEENYLAQKFARACLGTNNIDQCAQLCHAPTLLALSSALGYGAMTNSLTDLQEAGCILVIGSNTTETHPIAALKIKAAVRHGARLIVVNPRRTKLERFAELVLHPRPGTDTALLAGMMRVIMEEDLYDGAFLSRWCLGLHDFVLSLQEFDVPRVSEITGVPVADIVAAARLYASGGEDERHHLPEAEFVHPHPTPRKPVSAIVYGTGITHHHGALNAVRALLDLALLTGNLGKRGAGVNPLAGQNNVQGACDMGALPHFLPGYQRLDDEEVRTRFRRLWGVELPARPGRTLPEIFEGIHQGSIKALYIIGANPMLSEPDLAFVEECLRALDFLVVQDITLTETARLAHVVLPGTSFAEKDGTFTNTERRVQRVRQAIAPVGDSKPDWWIITELGRRFTARRQDREPAESSSPFGTWDYSHPAVVMVEIASLTPVYEGIGYERLEGEGVQWPCTSYFHPGTPVLYREGLPHKVRLWPLEYAPLQVQTSDEYPFLLITGRELLHYHTDKMTCRSLGIMEIRPESLVEINPEDAEALGIGERELVRVISPQGEVEAVASLSDRSPRGTVFMTFHFEKSPVNRLIGHAFDALSQSPELKACAVRVEPVERFG
ncbi:MAG: molybdopterin-dependent oxidoreductase [Anaerolineae bacterium]|nr:molybdopterin-dependent oxidoreductase [Anaerolineae bacterium]